jgi:hypothetical protein
VKSFSGVLLGLMVLVCSAVQAAADGPILLVTPQGVFQSDVAGNRPGPWKPVSIDVIVQGFTPGGGPPITIPPGGGDTSDPVVQQVSALSKTILKDKSEATAVASIVDALGKAGLAGEAFKDAIELSAPLADSSLQSAGRVTKWVKEATKVSTDPAKLSAGVRAAFGIESATTDMVIEQANRPEGAALPEEALDLALIIQLVSMIIDLLTKLGILGG